ncbi:MAG: signal peptidase I [Firmicutes bacterium]|nr:signal peptidase I [Bacillota bacterium]
MKKEKNNPSKKINKKVVVWLRFIFGVAIILGIGYLVFNYVPFFAKYDHYVISSGSMEPTIMTGDVVIINNQVPLDDLLPRDIIAFYADIRQDGNKVVVVHYLYSVTEVDGVRIYKTQPEVTDSVDGWDLVDSDIIGQHVLTIPKIGPVLLFLQSTIGRIVILADIVVIYVVVTMFQQTQKPKETIKEIESETETPKDSV